MTDSGAGDAAGSQDPAAAAPRRRARYLRPRPAVFGRLAEVTRTVGSTGMNDMIMSKIRTGL